MPSAAVAQLGGAVLDETATPTLSVLDDGPPSTIVTRLDGPQARDALQGPEGPPTGSENGPLAPAGHRCLDVRSTPALFAVGQYSKKESAGPLFAVSCALSLALSAATWVAASVVA